MILPTECQLTAKRQLEGGFDMSLVERVYKSSLIRGRIFKQHDAEVAHEWGMERLKRLQNSWWQMLLARQLLCYTHPMLETNVLGVKFPNPFGLAAGFDKEARVSRAMAALGFGFACVGTITQHKQSGHDRPRILRLAELQAIWNCMGFPNLGAEITAQIMQSLPPAPIPVFLNFGRSMKTPIGNEAEDYDFTLREMWPWVDCLEANLSSPNTPGLRLLQGEEQLRALLTVIQTANCEEADAYGEKPLPLGVKIGPDMREEQLADVVAVCIERQVDFITATNTTTSREGCAGWDIPADKGGISGPLLAQRSLEVQIEVARALKRAESEIAIIGVGGIGSGQELYERILHGASLCQAYTALVFKGPDFVRRCLKGLVRRLKADGFDNVQQAVGADL